MKYTKIVTIATIITLCIITLCGVATANAESNPEFGEFYPRLTMVVNVHGNVVTCEDREGNLWEFYTEEEDGDGWAVGDLCNLLMWNNSENIEDHEIVEVYFEGYAEDPAELLHILHH